MNENNYHLQYLIYALALEKYLKYKLINFDFEKQFGGVISLFLRGNRKGETYGVYTQNVSQDELDKLKTILN
jgi:exodeoxyribonuclease V beta subunit